MSDKIFTIKLISILFFVSLFAACQAAENKKTIQINGETYEIPSSSATEEQVAAGEKLYQEYTLKRRMKEGTTAAIIEQAVQLDYEAYTRAKIGGESWLKETEEILGQFKYLTETYPNSPELRKKYTLALGNVAAQVATSPRQGGVEYIEQLSERALKVIELDPSNPQPAFSVIFISEFWVRALNTAGASGDYTKPFAAIRKIRSKWPQDQSLARAHAEVFTKTSYKNLGVAEIDDFDLLMREWYTNVAFQAKFKRLYVLPDYKERIDKFAAGELQ